MLWKCWKDWKWPKVKKNNNFLNTIHAYKSSLNLSAQHDCYHLCSVGGWDDKFLQQENELKRVRSEKANLEQHILGMESELETLQEDSTTLKDEMETQRRTCSGMEQQIDTLTTEVSTVS